MAPTPDGPTPADECENCGCPDWENTRRGPACSACCAPWPVKEN